MASGRDITYLGRTTFRLSDKRFGIRQTDRRSHMYLIGKTGTGKSSLLRTMLLQDAAGGLGCALLDPHGDLARDIVDALPARSRSDFIYLDVPDPGLEWTFN